MFRAKPGEIDPGRWRYNVHMVKTSHTFPPEILIISVLSILLFAACQVSDPQTSASAPNTATTAQATTDATEVPTGDPFEGADLAITGIDGNILLADVGSKNVVQLTGDALPDPLNGETFIAYGEPTWSPSGEQLAFIRTVKVEGQPVVVDIVVASQDQENIEIRADSERPFYLYWSPTGDELSFLASRPGESITLWVKDLADSGGRIDQGQPLYWDWAPDGSRLFAHVGGSSDINPEGAYLSFFGPERRELDLAPLYFQAPAFSPDGAQILVTSRARTGSDSLLLLDAKGRILQDIVSVEGRASFAWAPDGSNFSTSVGPVIGGAHIGVLSLFRMNAEGRAELELEIADDVIAYWWSPDGDKIAYFVPVLSPPDLTQPISFNRQDDNELFLQLFVYDLDSGTSQRLTSFRPTSEFLRILAYYDQYQRSATIWSADSQLIAYPTSGQRGAGQIFIVNADGSDVPERIAAGEIAYWSNKTP